MRIPGYAASLVLWGVLALLPSPVSAQELEPLAYRPLPSGMNFVVGSYSYSSGNILVDPTAPLEGLEAEVHTMAFGYLRSFSLAGRSASISVVAPYVHMKASATVNGQFAKGSRSDWADARAKFTVNLLGAPAMSLPEFMSAPQGRTLGVGLTIVLPTGQYDMAKLINFGSNRWSFKPEVGYSSIYKHWIFEAAVGVWFFTTNSEGFGETTIRQDPIGSFQAHVTYNFKRGLWLALNLNYFTGGRTSVDGQDRDDLQSNSRTGLTLSIPIVGPHSLKLAAHRGAVTRAGADFKVGTIAYQYRWGGKEDLPEQTSPGPSSLD
jgi:hypothetical protein